VQFVPHFVALNKKSIRFWRLHNSLNVRSERSIGNERGSESGSESVQLEGAGDAEQKCSI